MEIFYTEIHRGRGWAKLLSVGAPSETCERCWGGGRGPCFRKFLMVSFLNRRF